MCLIEKCPFLFSYNFPLLLGKDKGLIFNVSINATGISIRVISFCFETTSRRFKLSFKLIIKNFYEISTKKYSRAYQVFLTYFDEFHVDRNFTMLNLNFQVNWAHSSHCEIKRFLQLQNWIFWESFVIFCFFFEWFGVPWCFGVFRGFCGLFRWKIEKFQRLPRLRTTFFSYF